MFFLQSESKNGLPRTSGWTGDRLGLAVHVSQTLESVLSSVGLSVHTWPAAQQGFVVRTMGVVCSDSHNRAVWHDLPKRSVLLTHFSGCISEVRVLKDSCRGCSF